MHHRHISHRSEKKRLHAACIFVVTFLLMQSSIVKLHAAPPYLSENNQKQTQPDLSQRIQIRFLTGTDFIPFNSLSKDGRLSGYNIDLIRALCQELALANRCQIEARPWKELLPALINDENDALIAGIQPDRTNREALVFTRPYLSLPARFVTTGKSNITDTNFSPDNKNIGVMRGTAHEALLKTYFPKAQSHAYNDADLMAQDLKNGKIQLVFGDAMSLSLQMNPAINATEKQSGLNDKCCRFVGGAYPAPEYLGRGMVIALQKKDSDLQNAFNFALDSLERKGVLNDLYLRYFPVNFY